jgi:hypothetical protein
MGLDTVELVMEIEAALDLAIPDQNAAQLGTPRDVVRYAAARRTMRREEACRSRALFYQLRRALAEIEGWEEQRLRLDTPLSIGFWRWGQVYETLRARCARDGWPLRLPRPRTLCELVQRLGCATIHPPAEGPWSMEELSYAVWRAVVSVTGRAGFRGTSHFVSDMQLD